VTEARTVLVTGTSSGIGRACALRLARAGLRVYAGVRRDDDAAQLRAASDGITPIRLDVTDSEQIAEAARVLAGAVGERGLDGLVDNAGIAVAGPLEFLPIEDLRHQLDVNVVGQVALTQALLPLLRQARGRIVLVGSIAGKSALPFVGAYSASKHALEAIADAWRVELAPWGIHVALIEPGAIATDIWRTSLAAAERTIARMPPAFHTLYGERLAAVRGAVGRAEASGLDVATVARAIEHALTAARPKPRYVIGLSARARLVLEMMPTRLRDRLIARQVDRLEEGA
jgi:NAD(P)-dependent dehydrogenase (short-subunit alcohol dehydrogenase family)